MPGRRPPPTFRGAAALAIIGILALHAASRHWYVRYGAPDGRTVMIWLGGIEAWRGGPSVAATTPRNPTPGPAGPATPAGASPGGAAAPPPPTFGSCFSAGRIARNRRLATTWWFYTDLRPRWHVIVPIWTLALLPAAPLAALHARRHARRLRGRCGPCGYDLTGIAAGLCPECGSRPR